MEYGIVKTDIGWCGAAASTRGLLAVVIGGKTRAHAEGLLSPYFFSMPGRQKKMSILGRLRRYAAGKSVDFRSITLDMTLSSPFERSVLTAVRQVPYGKTMSYRGIAEIVGRPLACRAVAHALAKNPFPIVVPCHRIIGSDGKMCGYSAPGGVALKRRLLRMEGSSCP